MKNLKSMNPIVIARNAIGVVILMTVLNMVMVLLNWPPIFPLALITPPILLSTINAIPESILEILKTPQDVTNFKFIWGGFAVLLIGLLVYSYLRSEKKPKAMKIAFGVIILDTLILLLNLNFTISSSTFSFLIQMAYHIFILYYIFKGIKSIKGTQNV